MQILPDRSRRSHQPAGQILPTLVVMMAVFLLMVGLAVDVGFAYVSRASLNRAVDAAALAAARNLSQGETFADQQARRVFAANYPGTGRDAAPVDLNVVFTTDPTLNKKVVTVSAGVPINTFFIRILPSWRTMNVGAEAEAVRNRVVMSLVLDRSGSMSRNGGGSALPAAVETFIRMFTDGYDQASLASFSAGASTDVPMTMGFTQPIIDAARGMVFDGGTWSEGGLSLAYDAVQNAKFDPADQPSKIVVFYTDGRANAYKTDVVCSSGGAPTTYAMGGYVSGPTIGLWDPVTGAQYCTSGSGAFSCCPLLVVDTTTFTSLDGQDKVLNWDNNTAEAKMRALAQADAMRQQNIAVYSVGLGDPNIVGADSIDVDFLKQIANDPSSATFNPDLPVGLALIAPQAKDLQATFQKLATAILLRLTR